MKVIEEDERKVIEEIKYKVIHSQRLAGFLLMRGFVLQGVRADKRTRRNVFLFNASEQLESAIGDYVQIAEFKKNKKEK